MKYKVTLNGKTYEVEVEAGKAMLVDEYEAYAPAPALFSQNEPLEPAAAAPAAAPAAVTLAAGETVNSPMPGTILKVNCTQGAAVKAGDVLVILEAMKMENEIMAPHDGTVAQVVTSKGATVDTGDPLVVLA